MSNIINSVILTTWPMIIVSVVIISTLRISYLLKNKMHFTFYKELFYLVAIIYILALFQIVTREDVVSWSTNNFIPLKEIFRYKLGSRLFLKNVIGNIIMFVPFGFFASYYLEEEKPKLVFFIALIASLTIEIVQMSIGRVFDVDDILLNSLGGLLGFYLYYYFKKFANSLPRILKSEIVLDIVALILLLVLLSLLWYNNYGDIMNKININVLVDEEIKELDKVIEVLYYAMEKEKLDNTCFDVIIVDNNYIHNINKQYRNIDRETDVITFALDDDKKVVNSSGVHILGDIYISIDKARSQAKEYDHSFLRELSFLAVHGFYHLLGYDHMNLEDEKIMFQKQEEVLEEYGIKREK